MRREWWVMNNSWGQEMMTRFPRFGDRHTRFPWQSTATSIADPSDRVAFIDGRDSRDGLEFSSKSIALSIDQRYREISHVGISDNGGCGSPPPDVLILRRRYLGRWMTYMCMADVNAHRRLH